MPSLSRADLEHAARAFFAELSEQIDQPRDFDPERLDEEVEQNLDASRRRGGELLDQLRMNSFDARVRAAAEEIASRAGVSFDGLSQAHQLLTLQLAARAEKLQMELHRHELTCPGTPFETDDQLGASRDEHVLEQERALGRVAPFESGDLLARVAQSYLARKKARGLSQSQIDETARALGWLVERMGQDRPIEGVHKRELARFRDDLQRIDVTLRGRNAPFDARLTSIAADQIKSVTALRYWRSVQSFFTWAAAEGHIENDPSQGLKLELRKGEIRRSPKPFSPDEVHAFLKTPLYAGYASPKRVMQPGDCLRRTGRWWAGILMMFTGLRAGELSQLLPSDFEFDAEIPYLRVREEDDSGAKVKSAKTGSSVRNIPIHSVLLALGLREFVKSRAKTYPQERVFREFRLGTGGRVSDGMSKFWSRYLKAFDLWQPGRATHVWRHTVISILRANDVAEEDIAAVVGHSLGTVTSRYGGEYPLPRKLKTLERLEFGFDVFAAVGGAFKPGAH